MHALLRLTMEAHGVKRHDLPRPLEVPRPDHVRRRRAPLRPPATRAEIAAKFARR